MIDLDKLCAQARARLKHWIGTKAGQAKAQIGRNRYQEQYAAMLERQERAARLRPSGTYFDDLPKERQ